MPEDLEEPRMAERPMHCNELEMQAQYIRGKYAGLGDSTLLKYYHFANSTPPFSPPAVSLGSCTQVREMVVRYMQRYLEERKLDDPVPHSWYVRRAGDVDESELCEIPKQHLHFYDGDSCEIFVPETSPLEPLLTGRDRHISVRLAYHDAPETKFSVRIYKQNGENAEENPPRMIPLLTRHIGIESLRAVRGSVASASAVYLHIPRDKDGEPQLELDFYQRYLTDIYLRDGHDSCRRLSAVLAMAGYTMSFYTTGIDEVTDANMRNAIRNEKGMFNLPMEVFSHPFRPWDLRHKNDGSPEARKLYQEYRPILNQPPDPVIQWKSKQPGAPAAHEDEDDSHESQEEDSFHFRFVECPLRHEGQCYIAKSLIANAGYGLFLKPYSGKYAVT